jgi:peptidoglycan/xylan/chitin deacetylase (PgdA/CDA1 family)
VTIPPQVERRARWVLETIGAGRLSIGDDLPYRPEAWERIDRGERPQGDEVAEAFFHLARVEERTGPRDRHGRFPASVTCLDPLDPPLERLRARLGIEPPRWRGARFAVALTHDVDTPWRWTRVGVRGAAARLKSHALAGRGRAALREARALSHVPVHRIRRTDPNWCFERVLAIERERQTSSTFFVLAGHRHAADGASPETYDRLRPRLVETLASGGAEIGLHGSYTAANDPDLLGEERDALEELAGPVAGQRYHYLRLDPHANLAGLERLGFRYDSSLGYAGAVGFRAGIAQPFRPWDPERDRPLDLVEIPLAVMDASFDDRYLGLSAREAEPHVRRLLEDAAERGGGFAILWHTDRFDRASSGSWDRLYQRILDVVGDLGGVCLTAGELAEEALNSLASR